MRGVRDDIFGGLVRNHPTTVAGFVTQASDIERALAARISHFHRQGDASILALPHPKLIAGGDSLRDITREVVREELRKLLPAAGRPASHSIFDTVRESLKQELQLKSLSTPQRKNWP